MAIGYLSELIKCNYESHTENRLSQIFSATFNNSAKFRSLFLRYISFPCKGNLKAITQKSYKVNNIDYYIDILLCVDDTPIIVIENKIDAPLERRQLENYNEISELKDTKKIAIVRHYFELFEAELNWDIDHWADLYVFLKMNLLTADGLDKFIIDNFLNHLEDLKMSRVTEISRSEISNLAEAFWVIRHNNKPVFSLTKPIFDTANNYMNMLEEIVDIARGNALLKERIGKNFRFSPWLGWWSNDDVEDKRHLWMGIELALNENYKNIKKLGTGVHFSNNDKRQCKVSAYVCDENDSYLDEHEYLGEELIFDKYAKQVIQFWGKKLK